MRTVVPALAETEFGLPPAAFGLLTAFVVGFGLVKAVMNFAAGHWSEHFGRRRILLWGWLTVVPVPLMVYFAPSWNWIVAATLLLGVNQGMTWSMTQTAKLDLSLPDQRGLTIGLNEFSGYFGVAVAGVLTGYLTAWLGARMGLLVFGSLTVALALLATWAWVRDTLPWAQAETQNTVAETQSAAARDPNQLGEQASSAQVFALMSWRERRFVALCQAGLVEKFVDALVWVFYPIYFYQHGLSLAAVGWVVGLYGFVWGGSQFLTGHLSDRVGRRWPTLAGMWLCAIGVALTLLGEGLVWWSVTAAITGFGMALLYPNLSAAISDIAQPGWRGTAIGVYRFWRDLGYGVGALLLGLVATLGGGVELGFIFVALAMSLSGLALWWWGEETHPRLNPAADAVMRRGKTPAIDLT